MAAQLEADDEPCSRIRVLGPSSSDVLCQHGNETLSAGPDFEGVLPSSDCNNYADVHNSSDFAVQDGNKQIPKRSSQLPSSYWPSWLWSSWGKISICDMCGMRWLRGTGNDPGMIQCQPKASPTAKTPLFRKGSDMYKIIGARRASRLSANSSSGSSPPSWPPPASSMLNQEVDQSVRSSKAKSKSAPKFPGAPPIAPTAKPRLAGMSEQEIIEMQAELLNLQRQRAHTRTGTTETKRIHRRGSTGAQTFRRATKFRLYQRRIRRRTSFE